MLARFTHAVRQFLVDDDAGSVSVETVIIMPILLWVYVATFVIFDGFRTHNQNVKAAYTIGDMLSRETNAIDNAYLEGLSDVFDFLTFGGKLVHTEPIAGSSKNQRDTTVQADLIWKF